MCAPPVPGFNDSLSVAAELAAGMIRTTMATARVRAGQRQPQRARSLMPLQCNHGAGIAIAFLRQPFRAGGEGPNATLHLSLPDD